MSRRAHIKRAKTLRKRTNLGVTFLKLRSRSIRGATRWASLWKKNARRAQAMRGYYHR